MSDIIKLPPNIINRDDKEKLESFGGHTIAHGRATRWHWNQDSEGDERFELYVGGKRETLAAWIVRNREHDEFIAYDWKQQVIGSGSLEHVLAELDDFFAFIHEEN